MAATFTFTPDTEGREVIGRDREITGVLTITGTSTTAGDALAASDAAAAALFGLARFDDLEFIDPITTTGAVPRFVRATRLVVFHGGAAAGAVLGALTNGTAVAGSIRVRARGK